MPSLVSSAFSSQPPLETTPSYPVHLIVESRQGALEELELLHGSSLLHGSMDLRAAPALGPTISRYRHLLLPPLSRCQSESGHDMLALLLLQLPKDPLCARTRTPNAILCRQRLTRARRPLISVNFDAGVGDAV